MPIEDSALETGGKTVADVLIKWGNRIQDEMRQFLNDNTVEGGTKNLEQSIIFLPLVVGNNVYTLEFNALDYFKFVDQGMQGAKTSTKAPRSPFKFKDKKPPIEPIKKWAYLANKNPFAVRESIYQKGTPPKNIIDNVLTPAFMDEMLTDVANAVGIDIELGISEALDGK